MGLQPKSHKSERTQTHALDIPTTGIGFSVIYSMYLEIRSTKKLLENHNKAQDIENKISNFYNYIRVHEKITLCYTHNVLWQEIS